MLVGFEVDVWVCFCYDGSLVGEVDVVNWGWFEGGLVVKVVGEVGLFGRGDVVMDYDGGMEEILLRKMIIWIFICMLYRYLVVR